MMRGSLIMHAKQLNVTGGACLVAFLTWTRYASSTTRNLANRSNQAPPHSPPLSASLTINVVANKTNDIPQHCRVSPSASEIPTSRIPDVIDIEIRIVCTNIVDTALVATRRTEQCL